VSEESTTPDLVERSQRLADAVNARDVDAAVSFYAQDAVYDGSRTVMGVLEGREAIRGFHEDWIGAYEDFEFTGEDVRDLGRGVTFALVSQRGRLPGTAGSVSHRVAFVSTWADGLIKRATAYTDIDEARAAAERLAEERG
jgi:ketosteroid isomerase-like protein